MKAFCFSIAVLLASLCECVQAEKLTLAHVAINPGQGMLLLAKDSGLLAKYGFTADVVLIPARCAQSPGSCDRAHRRLRLKRDRL